MSSSSLKAVLRTMLAWLYYYAGGFALHLYWRRRQKRNVLILTFHRVLPQGSPLLQNHLSLRSIIVTRENFQKLLGFLKRHFEFCSLEELVALPSQALKNFKPNCVLTFDDGYCDFYEHAWPIIQRAGVTTTMFLSSALVDTPHSFWWDALYHLGMTLKRIPQNNFDRDTLALLQDIVKAPQSGRASSVYRLIDHLQNWETEAVQSLITQLGESQSQYHLRAGNRLMTWEEINVLHAEGVHFGSHTRTHRNLAVLSAEQLHEEVAYSKHDLELRLHSPITAIAFPGGHFSKEALGAVAQSGYALACSTRRGFNRLGEDLLCMRRMNVWDGMLQDFRGRFSTAVCALNLMR